MGGLQLMSYLSIAFFVVVVAIKMAKIARMPIHIRWDLYPIPHESKGRNSYGGSYFEEVDWWTKPQDFSLISELTEMAKEIVLIQSVWHHNRPLWFFSFPFHFGMYCLCGFIALIVGGAVLNFAGIEVSAAASGIGGIVHLVTPVLGALGYFLAIFGAIGLFFMRLGGGDIAKASVRSDFVNLLMLLVVFVPGLYSWFTVDPEFVYFRSFFESLLTASAAGALPTSVNVQLWGIVALMFYFPFTHMTHMFGKYFTYHKTRWEDHPNIRGSKIEAQVQAALGYGITWAAPHIKSGGSWADAATAPEEDNQ